MKVLISVTFILMTFSTFAETISFDMKLVGVNSEGTRARFVKGPLSHDLENVVADVLCWGEGKDEIYIEDKDHGLTYTHGFKTSRECRELIKKAKGFLGLNYGTVRFVLDSESGELVSYKRL